MNVVLLPKGGYAPDRASLANELRNLADRIESGEKDARLVVCIIESSDGNKANIEAFGHNATWTQAFGLMEVAKVSTLIEMYR